MSVDKLLLFKYCEMKHFEPQMSEKGHQLNKLKALRSRSLVEWKTAADTYEGLLALL